jgi:homopolymeric O-antigen transport system permease protein
MKQAIGELYQYSDLLIILSWRDIKIRYKQSIMGFFWAILMPLLIVGAGLVVREAFSVFSGERINFQDLVSLTVRALPWAFFVGATRFATNSLTSNSNLVTKIYFPREVFPISTVLANLFDFAVASVALVIILVLARTKITIYFLWLPVILTVLILLVTGLGIFLACANLFFRDVKYIVEVLLTFGIFFTPVFYDVKMLGKWGPFLLLNPLAPLLEGLNDVLVLHRAPNLPWLAYATGWALFGLLVSWKIFKKAESSFAENI